MNLYTIALFVHIVSVVVLFAAITLDSTMVLGMERSRSVEQVRTWASLTLAVEKMHPVALVGILASGIYMVADSWAWTTAWTAVALLSLLCMATIGITVSGRRLTAIHRAAHESSDGPVSSTLREQIEDPVLRTAVQAGVFVAVGIVFLMTIKPDVLGSLGTMVVAVGLGLASTVPMWQRRRLRVPSVA